MAITYDADMQAQLAALLARSSNADLSDIQKVAIDDTWTTGDATPPGGAAGRALNILGQYANFFSVTDATESSIPIEWMPWFISEASLQASPVFPTAEETDLRRNNARARQDAILSYSRVAFDSTDDGLIGAFTIASLRSYVATHAIRNSPSVFLEPSIIDDGIEEVIAEVWNETDWLFKRKLVTLTISVLGVVTVSDSIVPDKLIGDRINYDSSFGGFCISVDYPTITNYKASDTTAGKPSYFHLLRTGDNLNWVFERTPDQIYTAKAMVTQQTPTMSSQATMDAALALFPSDFRGVVKNRVLAVCLSRVGRVAESVRLMEETDDKIHGLLARYDNPGGDPEWSEYNSIRPFGMGYNSGHIGGGGV